MQRTIHRPIPPPPPPQRTTMHLKQSLIPQNSPQSAAIASLTLLYARISSSLRAPRALRFVADSSLFSSSTIRSSSFLICSSDTASSRLSGAPSPLTCPTIASRTDLVRSLCGAHPRRIFTRRERDTQGGSRHNRGASIPRKQVGGALQRRNFSRLVAHDRLVIGSQL